MNTVVITAKTEISLDHLRLLLAPHWPLLKTPLDRLAIEESNSRVYIYHSKLDSGEKNAKEVYLDYSLTDLVQRVVQIIGDDPEILIDNECDPPYAWRQICSPASF